MAANGRSGAATGAVIGNLALVAAGAAALAVTWREAARPELPAWEGPAFDAINQLPAAGQVVWPVMQLGSLAAVPLLAITTDRATGDRALAARIGAAGLGAYLAAKVVKHRVGRGRPGELIPGAQLREQARGLGYPSGHSAEAFAMATVIAAAAPARWRWAPMATAAVVGVARVYYGAHLPHDVLGGAALGTALGGTINLGATALHHAGGHGPGGAT